eukprot:6274086-Alexandrium_andersonii.AAC.1
MIPSVKPSTVVVTEALVYGDLFAPDRPGQTTTLVWAAPRKTSGGLVRASICDHPWRSHRILFKIRAPTGSWGCGPHRRREEEPQRPEEGRHACQE